MEISGNQVAELEKKYSEGKMKLKKFFLRIVCSPILNKTKRRKTFNLLMSLSLSSWKNFKKFHKTKIKNKSILLIEPNNSHGECIPGFAKYFLDLGYDVDIIFDSRIALDKPFCRVKSKKINFYHFNFLLFKKIFKSEKIKKYKKIIILSSWDYASDKPFVANFPDLEKLPVLIVAHDMRDLKAEFEQKLLRDKKIIMLGDFKKYKFVNAHYFGDFPIHSKNKTTTFITVGGIDLSRKNHNLLIDAIKSLAKKTQNFKVVVIGSGKMDLIPENLRQFIEIRGRLNFPDMFSELEDGDFYLPLLDPENNQHNRYITTGITGSVNLISGFKKVPIIEQKFSEFYGFNNENSIVYCGNKSLADAMLFAIEMNAEEYAARVKSLAGLVQEKYKESLNNIKGLLE